MSLNPRIGHLYHDHNISNDFTALDAKERLRTREINAREAKFLERYSHVIDRAKNTCLKHNAWEQREVRKSLETIKSKTPSLSKSLFQETERKRLREFRRSKLQNGEGQLVRTTKSKTKPLLNPWSVYSQMPETRGNINSSTYNERSHSNRSDSSYNKKGKVVVGLTKTELLVRKAENIIRALHTLYTKGIERKRLESNTTVLEILGKESKEELEKALFVLRGTSTGDAIEDILRAKEHISKATNVRIKSIAGDKSRQQSLDEAFIARFSDEDTDSIDKVSDGSVDSKKYSKDSGSSASADKILLNIDDMLPDKSDDSGWENVFNEQTDMVKNAQGATSVDIRGIFEKDTTCSMSSVFANPSEIGSHPRTMTWTQLLKAPELWKTNTCAFRNTRLVNPKPVSLVTLTGKSRRSLLNR